VDGAAQNALLAFSLSFVHGYLDFSLFLFRLFLLQLFGGDSGSELTFVPLNQIKVTAANAAGKQQRTEHSDD
jgi:hypothetical protein